MYRDDIRTLFSEKRETKRKLLCDFIQIYIKMRIFLPNFIEERKILVRLISRYLECDKNESDILKIINKQFGSFEEIEEVDELLDQFDEIAEKQFKYFDGVFFDYESVIDDYSDFVDYLMSRIDAFKNGKEFTPGTNQRYRMRLGKPDYEMFDNSYKKNVLGIIGNIRKI